MNKSLREFIETNVKALNMMCSDEPYCIMIMDCEDHAEPAVRVENDFSVGDSVTVYNYIQADCGEDIEVLSGTVIEVGCHDDEGDYNRVQCGDRKFRTSIKNGGTRKGTKCKKN